MNRMHLAAKRWLRWPGLWPDVLLWGGVLALLAWGAWAWQTARDQASARQRVTLVFKDANEIVRGSNVRMMGVDIGYVDRIQLRGDHVQVTLSPARGMPPIPDGATATIEFTGLVGSKSVEIRPPEIPVTPSTSPSPHVQVQEPIRVRDAIAYNVDIANALKTGAQQFSDMFGRQEQVNALQRNIRASQQHTGKAVVRINNGIARLHALDSVYRSSRLDFARAHTGLLHTSEELTRLFDRQTFVPAVHPTLDYLAALFEEATLRLEAAVGVDRFFPQAQTRLARWQARLRLPTAWHVPEGITRQSLGVQATLEKTAERSLQADLLLQRCLLPGLHTLQSGLQTLGRLLRQGTQAL